MTIDNGLPWSSMDTEILRNFLASETGQRFLAKALESTPALLPSGDPTAIFIRSGEVRGCQILANAILSLANPPRLTDEKDANYPDLHDDEAWKAQ
jgi:hypothetical protein